MAVLRFRVVRPDPLDGRALRRQFRAEPALDGVNVDLLPAPDDPPGEVTVAVYHPADADPATVEAAVRGVLDAHTVWQQDRAQWAAYERLPTADAVWAREVLQDPSSSEAQQRQARVIAAVWLGQRNG